MTEKASWKHTDNSNKKCNNDDQYYSSKEDISALLIFYDYISQKDESFLEKNNYSAEEVLEGLKAIASETGLGDIGTILVNEYSGE